MHSTEKGIGRAIRQAKFASQRQKAEINLIYTYNWMRDRHAEAFKKFDLRSQHYNVMKIVMGQDPDPVSPGYIIDVMLDKKRDLTRLVDKLVNKGLVDRKLCPSNKRKVEIIMTDEGRRVVAQISSELASLEPSKPTLSEVEAKQLSDLLDKYRG